MHSRTLASTSRQALFNVFVSPCLSAHFSPHLVQTFSKQQPIIQQQSRRTVYKYTKIAATKPLSYETPEHPLDEKIGTQTVHLVSADAKLQAPTNLTELLRTINREEEHVRKVSTSEETGVPIVKIFTKLALREEARAKVKVKERKSEEDLTKQVEINWAITDNDLSYRLTRIETFLREGRRVEVLVAPKRGGRKATKEEIKELLGKVRESVGVVEGAEEWKQMEGVLGGQAVLFFQSREERERLRAREGRGEKLERKEKVKMEEKEKLERRLKRKKQREEDQERAKETLKRTLGGDSN